MTVLYRFFFAGLGVIAAAALSACANPVAEIIDDPSHPANPSAPTTAPAFAFSHSLEGAGEGPEPGAGMAAGSGVPSRSGSRMDHGQHGGAAR